jgi:hypothetical protein
MSSFGTEFKVAETNAISGGIQHKFKFANGYGASVVRHSFSYGNEDGLWELAVLQGERITYDTPLTDDVLGRLTEDDVREALEAIAVLPKPSAS